MATKISKIRIGTHSGTFHCDEALACYMLKKLPKYKDADIIRTRDQKELDKADIVVDVGGVFDLGRNRFDHHQKGFSETFDGKSKVKLSSAGLVYKYFGKEILENVLEKVSKEHLEILYLKIYEGFIKPIDGIDNGINQYDTEIEPLYRINTDLSRRVSFLNPSWNCKKKIPLDKLFESAMELTGSEFINCAKTYAEEWLPAREMVKKSLENRFEVDESGKIMKLEEFCPWKTHLLEIDTKKEVLYVLFKGYGNWRLTAVPIRASSFKNRKSIPEEWRGLRDDKLSDVVGLKGCIFVHGNGFTGAHESYEGAVKMAKLSVESKK